MKYNHKHGQNLIERAKAEGKTVKHVTIRIDEIQRNQTANGHYVICLVSKDNGGKFSAFENIWQA